MSELKPCPFCGKEDLYFELVEEGDTNIVCGWCGYKSQIFQTIGDATRWWQARPIEDELQKRIAELEAEIDSRKDQLREAKNILIDKNLHIDSLYEEGYKLQQRIAELEGERKVSFDLVRKLRMYCFNANWEYSDPEEADEFDEFDAEVCEYLSEYKEREE